jgi:hypothetical protein
MIEDAIIEVLRISPNGNWRLLELDAIVELVAQMASDVERAATLHELAQHPVIPDIAAEVAGMNDAECDLAKDVQRELDFQVQLGVIDGVLDVALPLVAKRLTGGRQG